MDFAHLVRAVVRDPLVHFIIVGGLIFGLQSALSLGEGEHSSRIVVDREKVQELRREWALRWRRPASGAELQALLAQHVDEEILYREARRLGLDREDVIIRRRLIQKMEFLQQDTRPPIEPGEAEIQKAVASYPASYGSYGEQTLRHLAKLKLAEDSRDESNRSLLERLRSRYEVSVEGGGP